MEMVKENTETASKAWAGAFTEAEEGLLQDVINAINAKVKVGCTGCRYCMPCPKNVDIPGTFAAYNRRYSDGRSMPIIAFIGVRISCDIFDRKLLTGLFIEDKDSFYTSDELSE